MSARFETLEVLSDRGGIRLLRVHDTQKAGEVLLRRLKVEDHMVDSIQTLLDVAMKGRIPGLERVLEAGTDAEGWFLIVERPPGMALSEILKNAPLTVQEFNQLAVQTLTTMQALHDQHAAHLSIRPENIWVEKVPEGLKVCICGIGEGYVEQGSEPTVWRCAAPEVWLGAAVGRRTDVYALGCTYYEALAGRAPFGGHTLDDVRTAHMRLKGDVPPLGPQAPQVQPWVAAWVHALIHPDSASRPRHAKAARAKYDLGVHGMEQNPSAKSASVPTSSGPMLPPGYVASSTSTIPIPLYTPTATAAVPLPAGGAASTHPVPGKPVAALPAARSAPPPVATTNKMPLYAALGAGILLLASLVYVFTSRPVEKPAAPPVTEMALATSSPPLPVAPTPSIAIQDAIIGARLPVYDRELKPPSIVELSALLTASDKVRCSLPDNPGIESEPAADQKVCIWRDSAPTEGFALAGKRDEPLTMPTLRVVQVHPSGGPHAVVSFEPTNCLVAKWKPGSHGFPFQKGRQHTGITVAQVLRCRPLPGILHRTVRIAKSHANTNTNVLSILVNDNNTFHALLGKEEKPVPPVTGVTGQFCILICAWNADTGTARLYCRTVDGKQQIGEETKDLPTERDAGDRMQIGNWNSQPSTSGENFNGELAETLVYNRGLGAEDVLRLQDWLADYYFKSR